MPFAQAKADPQPPQLFGSFAKLAHAALHRLYPALQLNVHPPETHAGFALATFVEHVCPHVPQLFASLFVSTHAPLQRVLAPAGHPDAHEYAPPSAPAAHRGVPPSAEQAAPQPPQLEAVENWTHAPPQRLVLGKQVKVQPPSTHVGWEFATLFAHAIPQPLQLFGSLVTSTQEPEQSIGAADGQPETHAYDPFEPAHTAAPPSPVHALPQLPQLAALVYSTHAPLHN
jgi:hypothetical protein